MNSQGCKIKRVYLKINYNNYLITIYGKQVNSNFIRKYKSFYDRQVKNY